MWQNEKSTALRRSGVRCLQSTVTHTTRYNDQDVCNFQKACRLWHLDEIISVFFLPRNDRKTKIFESCLKRVTNMDHIFLKVFVRNDLTMETTDSLKTIGTCSLFLLLIFWLFTRKLTIVVWIFWESSRRDAVLIVFTAKICLIVYNLGSNRILYTESAMFE